MWLDLKVQRRLQAAGQSFVLDVALQCTQRQVVLFGPSGAGKSLTLKAVAGLLRPGQGHVRVRGQTLFDAATGVNLPPHRRRLGYVFQDYALFPHLSVRQNVAFGLEKGWLNPRIGQRFDAVEQWLRAFRIDTVGDLLPSQVSGGQRQRTALARALVTQPQALLLDEPFSALDHDLRQHLRHELQAVLARTGIPLLLISHDPQDIHFFGQQVVHMESGQVVHGKEVSTGPDSNVQMVQPAAQAYPLLPPRNLSVEAFTSNASTCPPVSVNAHTGFGEGCRDEQ
ncbi:Sulfate/thiosulfate import ATP-binding protein CysA [compost metagenome]